MHLDDLIDSQLDNLIKDDNGKTQQSQPNNSKIADPEEKKLESVLQDPLTDPKKNYNNDDVQLNLEDFTKVMWKFYQEHYMTPTKLEKMMTPDFQFRFFVCFTLPQHCLALTFMLAMLDITVLNLGYIVFISYYCHHRAR